MRVRYKGPNGTGTTELDDDATLQALIEDLQVRTGVTRFTIKYGPPMAMRSLDLSLASMPARSLGLHGETLTIVPEESRAITPPVNEASKNETGPQSSRAIMDEKPEDINIPWSARDGTLCESSSLENLYAS